MLDTSLRRRILTTLLFGAAGFLTNLLRLEIFFNVDFIFGSVFVMLAVLHCGPMASTTVALLAGSATWALWNHPWAMTILLGEALWVGWLVRRKAQNLLLADLLYWMVLGAPLVWVFYHQVLHTQTPTTVLIVLKQAINGILNTLLAYLLHLAWQAQSRSPETARPAFRPIVFATLVSLVAFPALMFLAVYLRQAIQQEEQLLVRQTVELNRVARQALAVWIKDHHQVIATLAEWNARPGLTPGERQRSVELLREAIPAFKRVGVLDAKADVAAYSPLVDEEGRSTLGLNFADRPYIPTLKATLQPHVGDLVMGRVGHPAPMLPLLVPVLQEGRYAGYCVGVADTQQIQGLMRTLAGEGGPHLTVLDRNDRVVSSTRPELAVMAAFDRPAGDRKPFGQGVWHWIPRPQPGTSTMQRWRRSFLVQESPPDAEFPWTVVVQTPLTHLLDTLTRTSILGLGVLFLLILGTAALAHAISRGITESIGRLEEATRAFPLLLPSGEGADPVLPDSHIEEMRRLSGHFQQMAGALRASFQELRALKDTLERRVAMRTRELQTALDTIKTLHGIIPICASCKKIRDDRGSWNQLETYISEHTDAAFTHGICPDCARRLYPETRHGEPRQP